MGSFQKRILSNGLFIGLARSVRALGPILHTPLYILAWTSEGFGEWLVVTAVPTLLFLFHDGGVAQAVANEMGRLDAEDHDAARSSLNLSLNASIVAVFALMLVAFLSYECYVKTLRFEWLSHFDVAMIYIAHFAITSLALLVSAFVGAFRFLKEEYSYYRYQLLAAISDFVLILVMLLLKAHPWMISFGLLVIRFGLLIQIESIIYNKLGYGIRSFRIAGYTQYRRILRPALGFGMLPFINALQNQGLLLLAYGTTNAIAAANFQVTRTYANSILLFTGIASLSVQSELPSMIQTRNIPQLRKTLQIVLVTTATLSVLIAIALLAAGPIIFRYWTANRFGFDFVLTQLLILATIATSMMQAVMTIPRAANRIFNLTLLLGFLNFTLIVGFWLISDSTGVSSIALLLLVVELVSLLACCQALRSLMRELVADSSST